MTPELAPAQRDALRSGRAGDGVAAQQRLRALISLWRGEPQLREAAQRIALTDGATIDLRSGHRRYPVRLTLVLDDADHEALLSAKQSDGTEAAAVIRALVELWMSDAGLQQRVLQVAREQRAGSTRPRA
jgi:hypothetical protein